MRKASVFLPVLFALALVAPGVASRAQNSDQTRDRFVISAKAGGINAVTGRTGVQAPGSFEWEQLTIKDNLEAGDLVKTGVDGRVEMLLNPGSYLRVAENSEFELTNNTLDNLEVRLIRGTAIVEATGDDDTELMINITTPHTKMAIVRRGLYRVKVIPGDVTELIVRKGRVLLSDSHTKIKDGRKLIFSGPTFSVAKLEKSDKEMDDFDRWSKQRAETVAKANRVLRGRDLSALAISFNNSWYRGFGLRTSGFWWYNSRVGCYTFVPFFGGYGWGSPYGGSYSRSLFGGSIYAGRVYSPRNNDNQGYRPGSGSGTTRTGGNGGGAQPPPRQSQPSAPISHPERSMPRAAEGKVQRVNDHQP